MMLVSTLTDQEEVDPAVQEVLVEAVSHSDPLLRHTGLRAMEKLDRHVLVPLPSIMAAILVVSHDTEDKNKALANK